MATTSGPSSGTASLFMGVPPTCSVEVQVPAGLPSLGPAQAPNVDVQTAYTGTVINKMVAGVQITNPS